MLTLARKDTEPEADLNPQNPLESSQADNELLSILFEQYESASTPIKKQALIAQICVELTMHAQEEEEIFMRLDAGA